MCLNLAFIKDMQCITFHEGIGLKKIQTAQSILKQIHLNDAGLKTVRFNFAKSLADLTLLLLLVCENKRMHI